MKRTLFVSFVLVVLGAQLTGAQIIQPRRGFQPMAWTSLGVGWSQLQEICDPDTDACWNFGGAPQYRATLELPLGSQGASAGIAGTTSRVPLFWAGTGAAGNCAGCDADVNITQILGNLRLGGGSGFHQVLDLVLGATMFSDFRATDGTRLGTGKTVTDVTFALGYGFGYAFTSRAQVQITQEWGLLVHERQPGNPNNTSQQQTTRIAFRYGLGDR